MGVGLLAGARGWMPVCRLGRGVGCRVLLLSARGRVLLAGAGCWVLMADARCRVLMLGAGC